MKGIVFQKGLCGLIGCLWVAFLNAQQGTVVIERDGRVDQWLALKKTLNKTDYIEKRYCIQLYSGVLNEARNEVSRFKGLFPNITCEIRFETPNYKVWAGKYRTKLEADRYFAAMRKEYPNAFILMP